jgi:hypothetical protein
LLRHGVIRTHAAGLSKEGLSRMTDRYWKDRDRFDRATVADRDVPPRAGDDVRSSNVDRPYPDRDYSGISYGYTGGHAEDRSVHRSPVGLEKDSMLAPVSTGGLRRRSSAGGGTRRSRTRT